ncbi:MAG: SDR family NAD(P)-dependent oxidoreductase [Hyphomicrobiaceae bacterium]
MHSPPLTLIDRFLSRRARPDPQHLADIAHLKPMVVITGGSRGIGKALANRFVREGCGVVLVARHANTLQTATNDIRSRYPKADVWMLACDITEKNAVEKLKAGVEQQGGYIDVFINNAGLGLSGAFVDHSRPSVENLINLNIAGLTKFTHALLPDMLARGRGGIINICSLGAYVPGPYQATYYASKSYVQSLTEAIGYENRGRGVRIHASLPGPVNTPFHTEMDASSSLYQWLVPMMLPERTAASIVRSYKLGRRVAIPGIINTCLAIALRVLPHPVSIPIVAFLLQPRQTAAKKPKRTR